MPVSRLIRAGLILSLGLLVGCADQWFDRALVNPTGDQAEACLERCSRPTDECEGRQNRRAEECAERHAVAKADYDLCVTNGAGNCTRPTPCASVDMTICERQHEECVVACGGRVEETWRARPWQPRTTTAPTDGAQGTGTEGAPPKP